MSKLLCCSITVMYFSWTPEGWWWRTDSSGVEVSLGSQWIIPGGEMMVVGPE